MANLVHRVLLPPSSIKGVGKVKDEGIAFADVAIGMNDSGRHEDEERIVFSGIEHDVDGRVVRSVLPEVELIVAAEKSKSVGLHLMLVGSA